MGDGRLPSAGEDGETGGRLQSVVKLQGAKQTHGELFQAKKKKNFF